MSEVTWKPAQVSSKRPTGHNFWQRTIPAELIRQMRLNPATTYLLTDSGGAGRVFSTADASALVATCPRPFRVQTRRATGGRHIWVSCDPGHWEALTKKETK